MPIPEGFNPDYPECPKCGGPMWDNRNRKRNPNAPDFKCKDQGNCNGAVWMTAKGQGAKGAPRSGRSSEPSAPPLGPAAALKLMQWSFIQARKIVTADLKSCGLSDNNLAAATVTALPTVQDLASTLAIALTPYTRSQQAPVVSPPSPATEPPAAPTATRRIPTPTFEDAPPPESEDFLPF